MFRPKAPIISIVAIAVAVLVAGCATFDQPTSHVEGGDIAPAPTPAVVAQTEPVTTPEPTAAVEPTAAPTPSATPTATPSAAPTLVALPKLSKKVAGATKVKYFPIVGETPSELVAQTVAMSAKPCKSKTEDVLACVNWKGGGYRWIMKTNLSTGSCTVTSLTIAKTTSIVHLPRWVGPKQVQPALVSWWDKVLGHFAWHEGQHIKIRKSFEKKLRPLLVGHKCSAARTIIRRWERKLDKAQHAFDVKDYSWQPEWSVPYTGPLT